MLKRPSGRLAVGLELGAVAVVVLLIGFYALWRMDYLNPATAHHVRMTDSTRTAYVAKNIVEGRGYTTNELPAFLLDFYDDAGKLDDEHWVNSDRFPFTAYAVAALYTVTGSTDYEVGILVYNLLCFIIMLVLVWWLARVVWGDRWSALLALGIALLHPLTFVYLYLKDGDMIALSIGVMLGLYRYYQKPGDGLSWPRALLLGTLMAWLYLSRPNIGAAFILYFGLVILGRIGREWRTRGALATLRSVALHEGVVVAAVALWCLPFVIHSMSEWNQPFFSANALYQRPLGTRFAMQTDTWWKYSDPSSTITMDTLVQQAPDQLWAKFWTSWLATIKSTVGTWGMELVLALGLLGWLRRRVRGGDGEAGTGAGVSADAIERARLVRKLAGAVGFAVLLNFLLLPLYGWQKYGYRHYLSFFLPLIWICSGHALRLLGPALHPAWLRVRDHARAHTVAWLAAIAVAVVVWNAPVSAQDYSTVFTATGRFLARYWLFATVGLVLLAWQPRFFPGRPFLGVSIVVLALVLVRYRPNTEVKNHNLQWFAADPAAWAALRQEKGLVMSLAMQGEVNWASDRRNIPAPENVLHAYSFLFDHKLEVQDVYIESAQVMVEGTFLRAAPGFESYARLQRYQGRLPGYQIVFDARSVKGYPKFKLPTYRKASTIWRLADRDAVRAMGRSPDRLELGSVDAVVHTTHGWGAYVTIEGRSALMASDVTSKRYVGYRIEGADRPYEDTSVSFFIDQRRPRAIDFDIYATHTQRLEFFWNLDLYAYDRPRDRGPHALGTYNVTQLGWQRVHLEIPPGVMRTGLNKLGFKTDRFAPSGVCPPAVPGSEGNCTIRAMAFEEIDDVDDTKPAPRQSIFAGTLQFTY